MDTALILKALDYVPFSDRNVGDSRPRLSAEIDNREPSASGNLLEGIMARLQPHQSWEKMFYSLLPRRVRCAVWELKEDPNAGTCKGVRVVY